jgi:hypothetical protein
MSTKVQDPAAGTRAWVHFDSWAGRYRVPCEVLGRTKRGYKVRLLEAASARKPAGAVCYPPAWAVTFGA